MKDLAEHIELVVAICSFFIFCLLGLIIYLWKSNSTRLTNVESNQSRIQDRMADIKLDFAKIEIELVRLDKKITEKLSDVKTNYIDRFDDIKAVVSTQHIEVIEKISKLSNQINSNKNK